MAGEVCGTITGAALGIGLLYGEEQPEAAAHLTEQFVDRFRQEVGAVRCIDIIGFNFSDMTKNIDKNSILGIASFLAKGGKRHCSKIVGSAVEIALEQLNEWES